MHVRYALTACTRLNKSSPLNPLLRRCASRSLYVKPSSVEAADSSDASSIPSLSTPDATSPLKKKRTRKPKAKTPSEPTESQILAGKLDVEPAKRRGRPPKSIDTTETDALETRPKKSTRKPKAPEHQLSITHGSLYHSSLPEFLAHATTANLSPTSTVYRGTHYEYTVVNALSRLAFSLTRVGRASDLGIDLLGSWALPARPAPLNVLVQCKAEAPKPSMVRELEGAVVGAPTRYRGQGTIAILAAAKEATKGVREAVGRSGLPMAYLNITTEGRVRQFVWNQAAVECGLEGVGVALRYLVDGESEVALTWKGLPWSSSSSI